MHFVYVEADGSIRMSKSQLERIARDAYEDGYEKGKKECEATHDTIYNDGYKAGYVKGTTVGDKTAYPVKDCHEFYWGTNNPDPNFITPTVTCAESPKTYLNNTDATKATSSTASDSITLTNNAQVVTPAVEVEVKKDVPDVKKIKIQYPDDIFDLLNKLTKELNL
jgi:hypothetical protein